LAQISLCLRRAALGGAFIRTGDSECAGIATAAGGQQKNTEKREKNFHVCSR